MKANNFFLSILFFFAISVVNGQEGVTIEPEADGVFYTTSFNWKPFTLELNSSNVGHGISIEKDFMKNMAFRVGVSSDFKSDLYSSMGYKINFGLMYDFLNYRSLSLRTGIDIGMRKVQVYDIHSGIIGCFFGPIEPINVGFVDIPLLLQYQITEKFSLELGVRTMFQQPTDFSEMITGGRIDPYYYGDTIEKRIHNYHFGIRYTFN